ncbi:unnamed protein product, partial [Prorocentrum cordatum]
PRAGRRMAFKLREEPWRPKEEQPARPEVKRPAPGDADFPVDAETVRKNREGRVAYLEAREACQLEQKEINAVREQIGKEVRQACAPEIDEYVDCCVGRWFSLMACKPHALRMRRCMKKIETPEYVERRTAELMKERETAGESIVNNQGKGATRGRRAMYNRAILPEVDDPNEFLMRGKTGTRQFADSGRAARSLSSRAESRARRATARPHPCCLPPSNSCRAVTDTETADLKAHRM